MKTLKAIGVVALGILGLLIAILIVGGIGAVVFTHAAQSVRVEGTISSVSFNQGAQSWEITLNGGDTYYDVPSLGGGGYDLDAFHPLAYTSQFRVGDAITIWVDSDNFPTPAGGTSGNHEVVAVSFTDAGSPEFTSDYYRHPGHKTDAAWFWGRIAIGAAVSLFVLPFLALVLVAAGRRIWRVRPR